MQGLKPVEVMKENLSEFGFRFERGGTHTSRTMMLDELKKLLDYVDNLDAHKTEYLLAIDDENCLSKRSGKTRILSYRHLVELYSLDHSKALFRALLFFWNRDISGRPLIALICTYARDPIFRSTVPFFLKFQEGDIIRREQLEDFIDRQEPGRFSKATLKSTAQNLNATWTQSGHLQGRAKKVRVRAVATAGSLAYALFLGYLTGIRGQELFRTEYTKLLDCTFDKAIELAIDASRKGWIVFKRVGDVIEVLFPNLINQAEMEWLREQS